MKEYVSKHKWIVFLTLVCCVILGVAIYLYFFSNIEIDPIERNVANDGVITVLEGTLTRTSCIYEVPEDIWIRGECYSIDVLKNHKWQELEPLPGKEPPDMQVEIDAGILSLDMSFFITEDSMDEKDLQYKDLILERTNKNHTHMWRVNWDNVYGSLENGTYRLVVWRWSREELGKSYYYIPFTIDDTIS